MQHVQSAINSKLSFQNIGSSTQWPQSHQPYESTLNRLTQENNELKEKLNSRADNRFYQAVFQQYQCDLGLNHKVGQTVSECCTQTVTANVHLQKEVDALRQTLYAQNPSAASLVFMQQDAAAQTRLAEFHAFLRDNEQCRVQEHAAELQSSVISLSQQNNHLLTSMNVMKRQLYALQKVKFCLDLCNIVVSCR